VPVEAGAPRPVRPLLVWNARSGGGKALATRLADEARARGIRPVELREPDDVGALIRDAIAHGVDALGAAGGDGTQALVAALAAEHDLPFACIPAGTRNHFALDLGVDRSDVVGALDALVDGVERRVDLADVNGRVFVNNVSLGVYADAIRRVGYRDHKVRALLDSVRDRAGGAPTQRAEFRFDVPGGDGEAGAVLLVSNNPYRWGTPGGRSMRPRLDTGRLGIAALVETSAPRPPRLVQWEAETLDVDGDADLPLGIDGEAVTLASPLHLRSRPGALRVRTSVHHRGAGTPSPRSTEWRAR
jgi:diacylglycerol kinase family enzyme